MSLYSWEVVVVLAEQKSVTRAASVLNLSPSAVSHMLKKIETELGYELFVRNRNQFELTDRAKNLYPYILNYLQSGKALREEMTRLKDSTEGKVRIATYNNVIKRWLPDILKGFHEKYPHVKVVLRQSNDVAIKSMLEQGEIDLAIVFNEYFDSKSFFPLHRSHVICFTPADYSPANGVNMTAEDLKDMPIILRSDDYDDAMNRILLDAGIPLESEFRIDGDEACYEYIKQGFGFRITADITYDIRNNEVNLYPLEQGPSRILGMITAFPRYISPTVNLFRKEVIEYFSSHDLLNI